MEQAKAVINLKEGLIELECTVEFVREYLNLYRPAGVELAGAPQGAVATPKKEAAAWAAVSNRKKRSRAKRVLCADAVRDEVDLGFFAEPKSIQEVSGQLTEKGVTCTNRTIRTNLNKLAASGLLATLKEGRAVRYRRNG